MPSRSAPGSLPLDPSQLRAVTELRRRLQEVADRTAELEAEGATLHEVRGQLEAGERALSARLEVARDERAALETQLSKEGARVPTLQEEIADLELSNGSLESEVDSLEKQAAQVRQTLAELHSALAARREQRTQVRASLSGAVGSLAHLEFRLREDARTSIGEPPDDDG